jgi:hypothetical protein
MATAFTIMHLLLSLDMLYDIVYLPSKTMNNEVINANFELIHMPMHQARIPTHAFYSVYLRSKATGA